MKKIVVLFVTLITLMFLCSCSSGGNTRKIDNDRSTAQEKIEEILYAIQSKDKDKLTSLFSKDSLNKLQSFDESVEELFNYFEGTVESYDDGAGPYVETNREGIKTIKIMESSCEVKTTKCEYRLAVRYITQYTTNADKVGIQSLYIIKTSDDANSEYAYWGDGKFTPGIHIAKPNDD